MKKYVKIIDNNTNNISVGVGTDEQYYISQGFRLMQVQQDIDGNYYLPGHTTQYKFSEQDYDKILEQYIRTICIQRGYTTRQPSEYINSNVERWKQDAIDFIQFRDECMIFALDIYNNYQKNGIIPTLQEFKNSLPKIKWTIQ